MPDDLHSDNGVGNGSEEVPGPVTGASGPARPGGAPGPAEGTDRPPGVPAEASYIEEWELFPGGPKWPAWGIGERSGTAPTGRWRLWRPDGIPLEEGDWRDGKRHGTLLRYHDDGTLAVRAEHRDGTPVTVTGHRSDHPSCDPFSFDGWPPAVRTVVHDFDEGGTKVRWACFAADGTEVTMAGDPVPERPAGVPDTATYWPTGKWSAPRWRDGRLEGVARHWNPDGTPHLIVYNRAGDEVARHGDRPLAEAARDGDAASVELCLAAGLGNSPGVVRYAAYEELPQLALRLLRRDRAGEGPPAPVAAYEPGPPPPEAPADAVWVQSLESYVVGDVDEETGAAVGTWRIWKQSRSTSHFEHRYSEADFTDGRRAERRSYFAGGELSGLERRGPDGTRLRRSWDYRHRLDRETESAADGTRTVRSFHRDGAVRMERTTRDEALVVASWYDASGIRTAEVTAADTTVGGEPVEWWRALDAAGALVAEGAVEAGTGGGPVGPWRLYGADGTGLGTVTFDGLDRIAADADLGRIAHALPGWHAAPAGPELAGADTVPWSGLATFYGDARHLPFLLKGLTLPDPYAFSTALAVLSNLLWHQETITTATGPAFRYLTALVDRVATDDGRKRLLDLLAAVVTVDNATGETGESVSGQIRRLKSAFAGAPARGEWSTNDTGYTDYGWEDAYHEIFTSLAGAVPVWRALAAHPRADLRQLAVVLLAAAPGEAAAAVLYERLTAEPAAGIRAEILLGLALHEPGPRNLQSLERHLTDPDPLLRLCASLSHHRQGYAPAGDTDRTVTAPAEDGLDPARYHRLRLAGDELPTPSAPEAAG
ncbi:toxin-antitoxin system YwqK family antitoxin [Streptomyces sp. NPDC094448]|uniref:toxin-antitoxin system YwqK family antitoxin n=1 Tax=Streptomyces sp. NPDC094448 TaxID=3366063 RepID=UPI0037F57F93